MKTASTKFKTVDEYLSAFPVTTQKLLQEVRQAIKKAAPKAEEMISYNMPAFKFHGALVYYAAYKNHIGFYPTSSGIRVFKEELGNYKTSKGAIQFPVDKPIPLNLISRIVKFRAKENLEKELAKKSA